MSYMQYPRSGNNRADFSTHLKASRVGLNTSRRDPIESLETSEKEFAQRVTKLLTRNRFYIAMVSVEIWKKWNLRKVERDA